MHVRLGLNIGVTFTSLAPPLTFRGVAGLTMGVLTAGAAPTTTAPVHTSVVVAIL